MTRPIALAVILDNIPTTLRAECRWVLWRHVWDGQRWTKRPYQVNNLLARTDDPSTWTTFAQVCIALQTGRFDGLGFVLGDGWAGLDIDDYVGHAWPVLDALIAYRETSPSGQGIKIIGRSKRIGGQIDFAVQPPAFTTWSGARFFTVTGHNAAGNPLAELSPFIDEWFPLTPAFTTSSTREGYALAAETSDDDLIKQMAGADNGETFLTLWLGDTRAYGHDHSRADLALCCHLAFWTNYDAERIDRLFQQSQLMRPKWNRASYRRATIGKALR
jgi:putative DNA primase/helicase